jgi:hypothetical protein
MGSAVLVLALAIGLQQPGVQRYDTLVRAFNLDTAAHHVLLVDESGDPQMRARWGQIREAIHAVAKSLPEKTRLSVMTFSGDVRDVYDGPANALSLGAFPETPRGKYTDWGRALEAVYERSSGSRIPTIVFAVSICCVEGVDTPDPISPYADPRSDAWKTLKDEASANRSVFFVPVRIDGATFTYADSLAGIVGPNRVVAAPVNLTRLGRSIADIRRAVTAEMLRKLLPEELVAGFLELSYGLQGDSRQRLYLINRYPHLTVELERLDSVRGSKLSINLNGGGGRFAHLLQPGDSVGPITKSGGKGAVNERWHLDFHPTGWWVAAKVTDSLNAKGNIRFHGASEIAALNEQDSSGALSAQVRGPLLKVSNATFVNWGLVSSLGGLVVASTFGAAYARGRSRRRERPQRRRRTT